MAHHLYDRTGKSFSVVSWKDWPALMGKALARVISPSWRVLAAYAAGFDLNQIFALFVAIHESSNI